MTPTQTKPTNLTALLNLVAAARATQEDGLSRDSYIVAQAHKLATDGTVDALMAERDELLAALKRIESLAVRSPQLRQIAGDAIANVEGK